MKLYVVVAKLNVRNEPSTNSRILRQIGIGTSVDVSDNTYISNGYLWRRLTGGPGYVAEREIGAAGVIYLKAAPPAVNNPISTTSGQPMQRVTLSGGDFKIGSQRFTFTGANMRGLAYYGTRANGIQYATHEDVGRQLQGAKDAGMKVVRFWGCHVDVEPASTATLARIALDNLYQYGLRGIIVLDDSIGDAPFRLRSDWHSKGTPMGHIHKDFYAAGYTEQARVWWNQVEPVIRATINHPALFGYEIMNEPAIHPQPASSKDTGDFVRFLELCVNRIINIRRSTIIGAGFINARQVMPSDFSSQQAFFRRLYNEVDLSYASVHVYHYYNDSMPEMDYCYLDLKAANDINIPVIAGEVGTYSQNPAALRKVLDGLAPYCDGLMQWGWSSTPHDIGDGDGAGVMAYNGNYSAMVDVWKSYANHSTIK